MIKGIILDMDGLMFDTERIAIRAWHEASKKTGCPGLGRFARDYLIGSNWQAAWPLLRERFGEGLDFTAVNDIRSQYSLDYVEKHGVPLRPGLMELLAYLKENDYATALATSTGRERTEYYLEKSNLKPYFPRFVCGDMIRRSKPYPDIYLEASRLVGLPPEECMALEDSPIGITAAWRAGLKAVMVEDLMHPDEEIQKMLYARLHSLLEVIALLKERNSPN